VISEFLNVCRTKLGMDIATPSDYKSGQSRF